MLEDVAYYPPMPTEQLRGRADRSVAPVPVDVDVKSVALRRSAAVALIVGIPLSVVCFWLAVRGVDLEAVRATLARTSPRWLVGVLAAFSGTYVCFAMRWQRLVATLGPFRFRESLALVFVGAAVSNTVPGRPGELVRGAAAARRTHSKIAAGIATVFVDRAFDVFVLVAGAIVVLPLVPQSGWMGKVLLSAVGLAIVCGIVLWAAWWRVRGSGARRRPSERGTRSRLREALSAFVEGLASIRSFREAALLFALSAGAWVFWAVGAWCCAQSLGISLSATEVAVLTVVVNLGVAIPSSPGFVGTFQWLTVSALSVFSDVDRSSAFAFSVLLHAVAVIPATLVGFSILGVVVARRRAGSLAPREKARARGRTL